MREILEHLNLTKTSEVQKLRKNVAQHNRATRVERAESEQDEVLMQSLSIVLMTESFRRTLRTLPVALVSPLLAVVISVKTYAGYRGCRSFRVRLLDEHTPACRDLSQVESMNYLWLSSQMGDRVTEPT